LLTPIARAESTPTFTAQISAPDRSATGIWRLSAAEVSSLDALVQRDIDAARAGRTVAFAKTFIERRTPEERQLAGINHLTTPERDRLNVLVASAIANRPGVTEIVEHPAAASATAPTIEHLASYRRSPEIHGEVSVFVGAGSGGRSWYGGSFETEITDPSHHLTVAVGVSEIKGRGLRPCYGDPFYYDPFW
jgi:hypothetical protein